MTNLYNVEKTLLGECSSFQLLVRCSDDGFFRKVSMILEVA
jgi:hypothetical protein